MDAWLPAVFSDNTYYEYGDLIFGSLRELCPISVPHLKLHISNTNRVWDTQYKHSLKERYTEQERENANV